MSAPSLLLDFAAPRVRTTLTGMVLLVVGLSACALPLRRALRIDPTEALRAEG